LLACDECAHLHTRADTCTHVHTHSNYEKVVMELREGSAAKDAEMVELQKKLDVSNTLATQ
jgi:Zn-finger protein